METEERFVAILHENWINARHQESQRMWFANVFSAIFVGTLAYVSTIKLDELHWLRPSGLLVVSIVCLLVTMKLNRIFDDYKKSIKSILDSGKVNLGLREDEDWNDYVGMFRSDSLKIWRILRVRCLCIFLYLVGIGFSIYWSNRLELF
jgi:hypothetical protein